MGFVKPFSKINGSIIMVILGLLASACGQSGSETGGLADANEPVSPQPNLGEQQGVLEQNLPVPNNQQTDYFRVILYGNSHVSGLPSLIQLLINTGVPQVRVEVKNVGGGFLDESYYNDAYQARLTATPWTHAIFQGQKYSQSGTSIYPTTAAQKWLDKAKSLGITPILFPEHPQDGKLEEGEYVYQLHQGITSMQSSCLAPIPLVWERVIQLLPDVHLHAPDGNHASSLGNFLTALVFYEVITGRSADLLPYLSNIAISEQIQSIFGQVVSEVLADKPACPTF